MVFSKKKRNIFLNLITAVFTIGIFYFVFRTIDLKFFLEESKNINFYWLAVAYLFLLLPKSLTALRWQILIADYKKISFKESLKLQLVTDAISILIPLKMGELVSAFYDNDEKYTPKIGAGASVFEKILDFVFIFLLSMMGIAYFWGKDAISMLLLFFILFFIFLVIFLKSKNGIIFSKAAEKIRLLKRFSDVTQIIFLYLSTIQKNKKKLSTVLFISLASCCFSILQGCLIFGSINTEINPMLLLGAIPIGILVAAIPVTFFGIGTRDAVFVFLLGPYLASASIVLFGILFTLRYVIMAAIGLFYIKGVFKKVKLPVY